MPPPGAGSAAGLLAPVKSPPCPSKMRRDKGTRQRTTSSQLAVLGSQRGTVASWTAFAWARAPALHRTWHTSARLAVLGSQRSTGTSCAGEGARFTSDGDPVLSWQFMVL